MMSALVEPREEEISARLIEQLRDSHCVRGPLNPQTDLVMVGVLDSLMIMDLVAYVESTFHVRIDPREISPQNFRTIEALTRLITGKLADQPSGHISAGKRV